MDIELNILEKWIRESDNIVFITGKDFSAEAGFPDYRAMDEGYLERYKYPPDEILCFTFLQRNPFYFYRYYRERILPYVLSAQPSPAHEALARLEEAGKLKAILTVNIDGIHQEAGSKHVLELHGSVHRNYCEKCGKFYDLDYILHTEGIPRCSCGGTIKPDVVLYEESLNQNTLNESIRLISEADLLIIGGTSLNVWPAAGLINYYRGRHLVLINKSPVARDLSADLVITDPIAATLDQL